MSPSPETPCPPKFFEYSKPQKKQCDPTSTYPRNPLETLKHPKTLKIRNPQTAMQQVINEQNRKTDLINDELKKSKIESDTTLNEHKSLLYQKSSQLETALEAASKLGSLISTISRFLERFLEENIESKNSLESRLHFGSICSVRIRSRKRDIRKKVNLQKVQVPSESRTRKS